MREPMNRIQITLLDLIFLPIILSPIFLCIVHKDLRGFSSHIDTVIPLLFVYAPALALYLDSRLTNTVSNGYVFYAAVGLFVGFSAAFVVVTSFVNSTISFSNWAVALSALGLTASLLTRLVVQAFSQLRKSAG